MIEPASMVATLTDYWYAVEHADALGQQPRLVSLLNENYTIYRDSKGQPHAVVDRCPHRGASLRTGWMEGDCIRCPYHGWSFATDGRCITIPAEQKGATIPSLARLTTLPTLEKSGFIWIFPGERSQADPQLIPSFPEYKADGWRAVRGEYIWKAHFSRVVESGLDTSHAPFVHRPFFGNRNDASVEPLEIHATAGSVSCHVKSKPPKRLGLLKYIVKRDREFSSSTLTCYLPNINRIAIDFNWKGYQYIYFASNLPIDDETTLTKWIGVRNFLPRPWADRNSIRNTIDTYEEDRAVVETQEKGPSWASGHQELLLASDQLILAYRKAVAASSDLLATAR